MFGRFVSLVLLIWLFGFVWFAVALPGPESGAKTDAVIVYTGGRGRIERGLEALRAGWGKRMLVSGVDREVRAEEFRIEYEVPVRLMDCCVTLGYASYDTRSNALEAADWLSENRFGSVRLVTTDWHMRRAAYDFERARPDEIAVVYDAVPSEPSLRILFLEYHKLLARVLFGLWENSQS